jgi:hypothetical protein
MGEAPGLLIWSETMTMVVKKKLKEYIKSKSMEMGGDVLDTLDKEAMRVLDKAVFRCQANNRKVIRGVDL